MMTYQQQIKDPRWQKKRLEVLQCNGFECQTCGSKDEELHVHHPFYRRGAMIWEYEKTELQSLCHRCHKDAHAIDEKIKKEMSLLDKDGKLFLLGLLEAKNLQIKVRQDYGYDEKRCKISVKGGEEHLHAFGVACYFEIPPMLLLNQIEKDGSITLHDLNVLRRAYRIKHGFPVFPPATKEEV